MRKLVLGIAAAAAVALPLTACQSAKVDSAIRQNLPKICSGGAQIYSAFLVVAATGDLPAKAVRNGKAAYSALQAACRNPGSVNSTTALVTAAEAYAALVSALKEAK